MRMFADEYPSYWGATLKESILWSKLWHTTVVTSHPACIQWAVMPTLLADPNGLDNHDKRYNTCVAIQPVQNIHLYRNRIRNPFYKYLWNSPHLDPPKLTSVSACCVRNILWFRSKWGALRISCVRFHPKHYTTKYWKLTLILKSDPNIGIWSWNWNLT